MHKKLLCLLALNFIAFSVFAQDIRLKNVSFDENTGMPRWAEISLDQQVSENHFFQWLKLEYGLSPNITFKLLRSDTDNIGFIHQRYRQYFNDIEVMHSMLLVHLKNGFVESFNGDYYRNFRKLNQHVSPSVARDKLLGSYGLVTFRWEDKEEEEQLKFYTQNPDATWYPNVIPTVYHFDTLSHQAIPCYAVHVGILKPRLNEIVLLDVFDGRVIANFPQELGIDSAGKARTYFSGVQNITADFITKDSFRLVDNKRHMATVKWQFQKDYYDKDNYWNNQKEKVAGDIQWAGGHVMDLMKKYIGWTSFNNLGGTLKFTTATGAAGAAYWFRGSQVLNFFIDSTATIAPTASPDVVGHEAGHAFLDYLCNLEYSAEACALHESFADINGHLTEYLIDSTKANWSVAELVWFKTNGIRNMEDPWIFKGAKTFGGKYYPSECHLDTGIQNHWFFLMVQGDTATNEFGYKYQLSGLGHDRSAKIHYRGYQYYVTPLAKHKDVMRGSIKAARDLYGGCSYEVDYTFKAWKAVNIEDTSINTKDLSHGIKTISQLCKGAPVNANIGSYGDAFRKVWWQIDYKDTYNVNFFTYNFKTTGAHNVLLKTNACNKVFYDSMKLFVNYNPDPKFNSPFDTSCSGKSIDTFRNKTVNADKNIALLYYWYVNPAAVSDTSYDLTTSFPDGQDYEVSLKAYYPGGCWNIAKKLITILPSPHPTFDVVKNVCQNRELRLRNNSDSLLMPVTYTWFFPDSTSWTGHTPANKSLKKSGIFDIVLQASYANGHCTDTANRKIEILKNPIVDFNWENNCKNKTMVLQGSAVYNTPRQWTQWQLGNASPYNKDTLYLPPVDSTTRTVGFTAGDKNGCYATRFYTIKIVSVTAKGSISNVCSGIPSELTNTSLADTTFISTWDLGNGDTISGIKNNYLYKTSGKFNSTLIVNASGCRDTQHFQNEVWPTPASAFTSDPVCANDTTYFINQTPDKNLFSHKWYFGDNDSSVLSDPKHAYKITKTTTWFVTLKSWSDKGCENTITKTTTVNELPKCGFSGSIFENNPAAFSFQTTNPGSGNFKWHFGDGDSSTAVNPLHVYSAPGTYNVSLKIKNSAGCECEEMHTFTSGTNQITSVLPNHILVYPNPAHDVLFVENLLPSVPGNSAIHASLMNSAGQIIACQNGNLSEITAINLSSVLPGFYVLKLHLDGIDYFQKIIRN